MTAFSYPGLSQVYYLKGAAGAFGLLTAAGIAAVLPVRARYVALIACVSVAGLVGGVAVLVVRAIGPSDIPTLARTQLFGVLPAIILPVLALVGIAGGAYVLLASVAPDRPALRGAGPLLIIALVMGFSLPNVATLLASPFVGERLSGETIPGDGVAAARWLRDHSDTGDVVATNLHCRGLLHRPEVCDARHFWVSGYSERRMVVEGWAYTQRATASAMELGVSDRTVPFWDQTLLALNDLAFSHPTPAVLAALQDQLGVRWLFADLTGADSDALVRMADLRYREGTFAVYELRRP